MIEHVFVTFTMSFQVPATIVFFVLLTKPNSRPNFIIMSVFAICLILPTFMDAIRTASRSMVVSLFIRLLLCYSMFKGYFSANLKRLFLSGGLLLVVFLIGYSLMVTEARFGDADSGGISSLICYWGQPTLVFNSQVMDVNEHSFGKIFFLPLYEAAGIDSSSLFIRMCKGFGSCFTTSIGTFYLDFGLIGILLMAFVVPAFINKIINRAKVIDISKLYLMLFYCLFLQNGALTIKWGFITSIGLCTFFYFVLKLMTPNRKCIKQVA